MIDKTRIKKIRESFPEVSIQSKYGFKNAETGEVTYLTGFKPQYVIERFNDCFGHDGWDFEILEHGDSGKFAWVKGRITIYEVKYETDTIDAPVKRKKLSTREQFGTSRISTLTGMGDALKGAATNCFEKTASLFDIGHEAYKGLVELPKKEQPIVNIANAKVQLLKECKTYEIGKVAFKQLQLTVLKEEKDIKNMSLEEMQKLIKHLQDKKAPY